MENETKNLDEYSMYINMLETGKRYMAMMNKYRCAIMEVETKLKVLNTEFSLQYDRNPFESIKSRLKSPVSIMEKLRRKGLPINEEVLEQQIEENLFDVAGLRVICAFQEDIYALSDLLVHQDDIQLLRTKVISKIRNRTATQFASDSGYPGIFEGRENVCEGRSAVSDDCDGFLGKCRS